ncbi:MAG: SCO family protein [Pseudomonadota bacterium]
MIRRALVLSLVGTSAFAHNGVVHKSPAEARAHRAQTSTPSLPSGADIPLPFDLGGSFTLTDQNGVPRSEADPKGRMQLLFFGYANCQAICSVALPLMAEATDALAAQGVDMQPVMVTVDPERDTVETIGPALAKHHSDFVGLTGAPEELAPVYDLFSVAHEIVFEDPELGPVYAHGSHIYLMDDKGAVLTLLPPILSGDRVIEIVMSYAKKAAGS